MSKPEATVSYPSEVALDQTDPAFYSWTGHDLVAIVKAGTQTIHVHCDGEMRFRIWPSKDARERNEDPETVRYCDQLEKLGIKNDSDLFAAEEEGQIDWVNNSWFDLYDPDSNDGWLDRVHGDLVSAIDDAKMIVGHRELLRQWIPNR